MLIGQCLQDITLSHGLVISLFMAGLVGGFTHCSGMCSPFVLAQSGGSQEIKRISGRLLLPYHLGRMTTYVSLAVLVSSFVNLAFIGSELKMFIAAPMLMLAAVIFFVSAFPAMQGLFPWAVKFQIVAPFSFLTKLIAAQISKPGVLGRYGLGILLGFMPCGLVISALLAAGTAPDALMAGGAMAAFAVGTMPALMLVGLGGGMLKYKYPTMSQRLSQGAMIVSSFWLVMLATMMVL